MSHDVILDLPMKPNDAEASTVREYLIALLKEVWTQEEGFSGKRPFGNSGWQWDLYEPLVRAGVVWGTFDSDGYLGEVDTAAAHDVILDAIGHL